MSSKRESELIVATHATRSDGIVDVANANANAKDGAIVDNKQRTAIDVASLIESFSPLALTGTALIVASGLISSFAHIETLGDFVNTQYGITLLAKVASVAVVVLFGWRNWKVVTPTLHSNGPLRMTRAMRGELFATALVLFVTAVLVVTVPPMAGMAMPP